MDKLSAWYSPMADVSCLLSLWETRNEAGTANTKRCREILTACLFTLCLENNEGNKRFLIGFQRGCHGRPHGFLTANPHLVRRPVTELFTDEFGENGDIDVILVPDFGLEDLSDREIHQCQILGYLSRTNPGPYDLVTFVEEKKLRYCPPDNDLRLIINIEQKTEFDPGLLSAYLRGRKPSCPYSQVFLLGQIGENEDRYWLCWQLYPELIPFKALSLSTLRSLLPDRKTHCEFVPGPPPEQLGPEWFKKASPN
jgi:hypothetical protein